MPFAFSQIEPRTTGQVTSWDIPINEWWGAKWAQADYHTIGSSLFRMGEDMDQGPLVNPTVLNQMYGKLGMKFDVPVGIQQAARMAERKIAEMERDAYLNSASHRWYSLKGISGFGVEMLSQMTAFPDFALMFMPVVGRAAGALDIAKAGGGPIRQAIARGLITEETLAGLPAIGRFPLFTSSILQGAAYAGAAEIPNFIEAYRSKEDYSVQDALANIAAGGIMSGLFHAGLKGLGKAKTTLALGLRRAAEIHEMLEPGTKDAMLRKAINDMVTGRDVRIHEFVDQDGNIQRRRVHWDEAKARVEATQKVQEELGVKTTTGILPSGFHPPPEPKTFSTIEEALAYKKAYRTAELEFYKSLGLSDKEAEKMLRASDARSNIEIGKIEDKLSPEQKQRLDLFSTGEGREMYQYDRLFDPERILGETDKKQLAHDFVFSISKDQGLPNEIGDHLIFAITALRKLKELGATWKDVALELDKWSASQSSSASDKLELFKIYTEKIKQFARQHGIELPMDEFTPASALLETIETQTSSEAGLEAERIKRIEALVAAKKAEFEKLPNADITKAEAVELDKQSKQTQFVDLKDVERYDFKDDDKTLATLKEENANIEMNLVDEMNQRLSAMTEEQRLAANLDPEKLMKELKESVPESHAKAVEAAYACVLDDLLTPE